MSGEQLHDILKEIDTNMNGQVELDEYLQVCWFFFGRSVNVLEEKGYYISSLIKKDLIERNR